MQSTSSSSSGLNDRKDVAPVLGWGGAELAAALEGAASFEGPFSPGDGAAAAREGPLGCPPRFEAPFAEFFRDRATGADDRGVALGGYGELYLVVLPATGPIFSSTLLRAPISVSGQSALPDVGAVAQTGHGVITPLAKKGTAGFSRVPRRPRDKQ